jgi:acyl-coenzyme A synthetase/AMP-(fatty) acid ligase
LNVFNTILSRSKKSKKVLLKDENYSYDQFYKDTILYFNFFKKHLRKKDVIALSLNYSKDYLNIIFAAQKNGNIVTFINPNAPKNEKKFLIKNSKSKLFISRDRLFKSKFKTLNNLYINFFSDSFNNKIKKGDAFIIYTSGTTSRPKGVILTTNSVSSNINAISHDLKLTNKDSTIIFSPPHYAMAYSQILTYMLNQMSFILISSGFKFPGSILDKIIMHKINVINLSISSFRILYPIIKKKKKLLKNIRLIMSGGMQMTKENIYEYKKIFNKATIVNFYGCTENSPRISHFHVNLKKLKKYKNIIPVGKTLKGVKINIIKKNKNDKFGKIFVSGTSLMRGYLLENSELKKKFKDNCFNTGDIGRFDKNKNIFLMGREDDTFRVGHEKLCPEEIEPIIKKKLKLKRDVIVGKLKNKILDWEPVLVTIKSDYKKNRKSLKDIKKKLNNYLVNYKIPRKVIALNNMPKTLYGKIDRKKINEIIQKKKI